MWRCFFALVARKFASVAQSVEQWTENPRVVGSIPTGGTNDNQQAGQRTLLFIVICGSDSVVECHLAKVKVASSNLVSRSTKVPMCRLRGVNVSTRRHSQVVRQRSAKPSFPGSNPGGASKVNLLKSL